MAFLCGYAMERVRFCVLLSGRGANCLGGCAICRKLSALWCKLSQTVWVVVQFVWLVVQIVAIWCKLSVVRVMAVAAFLRFMFLKRRK